MFVNLPSVKRNTCWLTCRILTEQLTEQVLAREGEGIDKILSEREKYWQVQLFTLTHELNRIIERYAIYRQGYRQ